MIGIFIFQIGMLLEPQIKQVSVKCILLDINN